MDTLTFFESNVLSPVANGSSAFLGHGDAGSTGLRGSVALRFARMGQRDEDTKNVKTFHR